MAFWEALARRSQLMAELAEDTSAVGIDAPGIGFGEAQIAEGRISVFDHGALPLMRNGKLQVRRR